MALIQVSAVPMADARDKMLRLEEIAPGNSVEPIYSFMRYLADERITDNDRLSPTGYVMLCELALIDLETGINGFTGQPINNSLTGYPSDIYLAIRGAAVDAAKHLFTEQFATAVQAAFDDIHSKP